MKQNVIKENLNDKHIYLFISTNKKDFLGGSQNDRGSAGVS